MAADMEFPGDGDAPDPGQQQLFDEAETSAIRPAETNPPPEPGIGEEPDAKPADRPEDAPTRPPPSDNGDPP